jgi:transcription initiation factor TFIID subunit TAF12
MTTDKKSFSKSPPGRREKCRDSIACSETDLELVLGAVGHKRHLMQQQQLQCNMHSWGQQQQQQQHQQQQQKQLKGILKKDSSFSKPTSITTNPTANVIVINSSDRESSASWCQCHNKTMFLALN